LAFVKKMRVYSFEKLEVWQEARKLVRWIYKVTAEFPEDEKFGLVRQLRRAAISIVSNLAEGSSRNSAKEQAYFSQISYSSVLEVLNQLILSFDLSFLSENKLKQAREMIEMLTIKIASLRKAQLNRIKV
jgi:four helix bundle protein